MQSDAISRLSESIRDVPNFPKKGITFKDITPILGDPELFKLSIDSLIKISGAEKADKIVGIDARGFIFGAAMAYKLGIGFIPLRKKGKLPWDSISEKYDLEYGSAEIEMHKDACAPGEFVLIVDDLLATGGTARAAANLIQTTEANLLGMTFLVELEFLKARDSYQNLPITSLLKY